MKTLARPQDRDELRTRLRRVGQESTRRWGRMSAHQMMCHMADAFRMALGDKPVADASNVLTRTLLRYLVLYAPVHWPEGAVTSPEIDQCGGGGTGPVEFAADAAQVERLMEVVAAAKGHAWPPHPVFGRMSDAQWHRWGYLHTDHHLRQFGA